MWRANAGCGYSSVVLVAARKESRCIVEWSAAVGQYVLLRSGIERD
ncbi:hypothetical protein V1282_003395 [Nitrobacteraceae bacterium AZCC 2146]